MSSSNEELIRQFMDFLAQREALSDADLDDEEDLQEEEEEPWVDHTKTRRGTFQDGKERTFKLLQETGTIVRFNLIPVLKQRELRSNIDLRYVWMLVDEGRVKVERQKRAGHNSYRYRFTALEDGE